MLEKSIRSHLDALKFIFHLDCQYSIGLSGDYSKASSANNLTSEARLLGRLFTYKRNNSRPKAVLLETLDITVF